MVTRKSLVSMLVVAALLSMALTACVGTTPRVQVGVEDKAPSTTGAQRSITVVGVGKVGLVPDIARINVGVDAKAPVVSEAKGQVDRAMVAIVAALRGMGVPDKDIQTSSYSIFFEDQPGVPEARGSASAGQRAGAYRVSNMLLVTVRDVQKAGDVLEAVVDAGANQVYGVTFTVADDQRWQGAAREKAMADAKVRALDLARLSGAELGQVLQVSEVIGSSPVFAVAAERAMGGGGIAPGELELSAQVQVTFAVK